MNNNNNDQNKLVEDKNNNQEHVKSHPDSSAGTKSSERMDTAPRRGYTEGGFYKTAPTNSTANRSNNTGTRFPRRDHTGTGSPRGEYSRSTARPSHLSQYLVERKGVCRTREKGRVRRISILTAIGDAQQHKVGLGAGKSYTAQAAAKQAEIVAERNMKQMKVVKLKNGTVTTIPQRMIFKAHGLKLIMQPMYTPNRIVANNLIRKICEAAGINSINVKVIGGSTSKWNQANCMVQAASIIETREEVAKRCGKTPQEIDERNFSFVKARKKK